MVARICHVRRRVGGCPTVRGVVKTARRLGRLLRQAPASPRRSAAPAPTAAPPRQRRPASSARPTPPRRAGQSSRRRRCDPWRASSSPPVAHVRREPLDGQRLAHEELDGLLDGDARRERVAHIRVRELDGVDDHARRRPRARRVREHAHVNVPDSNLERWREEQRRWWEERWREEQRNASVELPLAAARF